MSNITIKAEFLAGTSFKAAIAEARDLSRRMSVAYVEFQFNGVTCNIGQDADLLLAEEDYRDGATHITYA